MAACQARPSLGFSRQEYWSGLPFPSPMHESEKGKWSRVRLLATPWTAAHQTPLSMGFSRQKYWSGVPLPSPMYGLKFSIWPVRNVGRSVTESKQLSQGFVLVQILMGLLILVTPLELSFWNLKGILKWKINFYGDRKTVILRFQIGIFGFLSKGKKL